MEIWKDVKGYEGIYEVSSDGRVKSIKFGKEKILKTFTDSRGYFLVALYKDKKRSIKKSHQLVAINFLNHTPCGHTIVVDHIDNDKTNNRLCNLQLISSRENSTKDKVGYSSKYVGVSWNKRMNKYRVCIFINGKEKHLGYFSNEEEGSMAYKLALKNHLDKQINSQKQYL